MQKIKATKTQVFACVLIVILAAVMGAVGLYGMNSRSADAGVKLLQDMRLQAILDTAGTGAVDAYVAAEKAAVTQQIRAAGGKMKEIREATAKVEVEALAKAEELGIGEVDLSNVDTAPLGAALNVMVDAQQAYYAEEARAQAEYVELNKNAVVTNEAEEAEAASADDEGSDMEMAEEVVDLSGFVATEEMNRLAAVVEETYAGLCEEIKVVFPALTDDILETLKPTITKLTAQQNDTFEKTYDRAQEASGIDAGMYGWMLRNARTLALSAIGVLILAVVVLLYTPLVEKMGVPRLIIGGFYVLLCLMALILNMSLATQLSNTLVRMGMNGILVLSMLPGIQCGISLNLGMPIGIIGGLLGGLLCIELGIQGFAGFVFSCVVGIAISAVTGYFYGLLLNRLKGEEMSVTTYVGFSIVSLMCIGWLVLPFKSPIMKWPLGPGLRTTIGLQSAYKHVLNKFLSFEIFGMVIPTGLLLFFALCCFLMWLFLRSKTGIAMSAAGANPRFAAATGIDVDKMRILGTTLSTMIAAVGIIVYGQSYGFMQLYQAPRQMGFLAASAILLGGASTSRARISHVVIGTFLFQGVLTLGMPVANALIPGSTISETLRILISNGIILYALTKSGGASRG